MQPSACRPPLTEKQASSNALLTVPALVIEICLIATSVRTVWCADIPNMPAGDMERARRTTGADQPLASSQFRGHQRESDRRSKAALDLSVTGRHIGPASASFSAEPRHAVSWEDEQQRPASSPEPVHGSNSRNEWAGVPRRHAQSQGFLPLNRVVAVCHHEARCHLLCRALGAPLSKPGVFLSQWQHMVDLFASERSRILRMLVLQGLLCGWSIQ